MSNFGSSNLSAPTADNDTNKIAEAFDRIGRFIRWIKASVLHIAKMVRFKLTNQISDQPSGKPSHQTLLSSTKTITDARDGGLEISEDEILANGLMKKNPKDRLEVTIGTGMEFTIHGDSKTNIKRGKNNISKSKTIGNSILEHGDFLSHFDEDEISIKSYGSHKYRIKIDSHKGSIDLHDEHEEKRDASKEELGIAEGKY